MSFKIKYIFYYLLALADKASHIAYFQVHCLATASNMERLWTKKSTKMAKKRPKMVLKLNIYLLLSFGFGR